MLDGTVSHSTPFQKAELLNNYFGEQSTSDIPNNYSLPPFCFHTAARLENIFITEDQVLKVLCNLNANKASGPDGIGNRLLKYIAFSICKPLTILFNRCLNEGIFPEDWKEANVTPIYKKNDKIYPIK